MLVSELLDLINGDVELQTILTSSMPASIQDTKIISIHECIVKAMLYFVRRTEGPVPH